MKKTPIKKSHTLLKGEGINQHTLYGKFGIEEGKSDLMELSVKEDSILKHETPSGEFAEHQALKIEQGEWIMGRQVEYNPFDKKVTRVWD